VDDSLVEAQLPPALQSSISFLTIRLRNEFRIRLFERYARDGMTPTSGAILLCIEANPPLTQKSLSELFRMDPSDAVRILDELEQLNLVQRVPDPSDRRRKLLVLTDAGREQTVRCRQIMNAAEDDLLTAIDDRERDTLRTLLRKVISSVDTRISFDERPLTDQIDRSSLAISPAR
jgi:DNA-binding MarR family transcriptional regulator